MVRLARRIGSGSMNDVQDSILSYSTNTVPPKLCIAWAQCLHPEWALLHFTAKLLDPGL